VEVGSRGWNKGGVSSWEGIESASATIMSGMTFYLTLAREGEGRGGRVRGGEGGRGREGEGGREWEALLTVCLLLECACGQG